MTGLLPDPSKKIPVSRASLERAASALIHQINSAKSNALFSENSTIGEILRQGATAAEDSLTEIRAAISSN